MSSMHIDRACVPSTGQPEPANTRKVSFLDVGIAEGWEIVAGSKARTQ